MVDEAAPEPITIDPFLSEPLAIPKEDIERWLGLDEDKPVAIYLKRNELDQLYLMIRAINLSIDEMHKSCSKQKAGDVEGAGLSAIRSQQFNMEAANRNSMLMTAIMHSAHVMPDA